MRIIAFLASVAYATLAFATSSTAVHFKLGDSVPAEWLQPILQSFNRPIAAGVTRSLPCQVLWAADVSVITTSDGIHHVTNEEAGATSTTSVPLAIGRGCLFGKPLKTMFDINFVDQDSQLQERIQ